MRIICKDREDKKVKNWSYNSPKCRRSKRKREYNLVVGWMRRWCFHVPFSHFLLHLLQILLLPHPWLDLSLSLSLSLSFSLFLPISFSIQMSQFVISSVMALWLFLYFDSVWAWEDGMSKLGSERWSEVDHRHAIFTSSPIGVAIHFLSEESECWI